MQSLIIVIRLSDRRAQLKPQSVEAEQRAERSSKGDKEFSKFEKKRSEYSLDELRGASVKARCFAKRARMKQITKVVKELK
jgi:hypothetical protein